MKLLTSRWLQAFALLAVVLAIGCGPSDSGSGTGGGSGTKRFIFLTNGDDPFWDACNAGLQDGAKAFDCEAAGIKVVMEKNNGTAQGQIDKLRQFASQSDIAGVAVSVIQADNAAIIEEMKNLQKKGVKIITVDGDANLEKFPDARPYYIGTNNNVGGEVLGQACRELLKARSVDTGGYVQFAGFTDNDNARSRMNGFKKAVGDEYTEKDRMPDEMNLSRARDNVRNALNNHPDTVALVGIWAYNAPAIAEVVEERKVRDKTTIVTFDAQAIAIEHMTAGRIDAMVVQNPFEMGRQAVRLLKAMHEGDDKVVAEMFPNHGQAGGDIYTTGLRLVVPDEGSPLKSENYDAEVVEYIPLSKFQEWLKKYNLTSS
jgi:ribose transport system substrate-binding protein